MKDNDTQFLAEAYDSMSKKKVKEEREFDDFDIGPQSDEGASQYEDEQEAIKKMNVANTPTNMFEIMSKIINMGIFEDHEFHATPFGMAIEFEYKDGHKYILDIRELKD